MLPLLSSFRANRGKTRSFLFSLLPLFNPAPNYTYSIVSGSLPLMYEHGARIRHVAVQVDESLLLIRHNNPFLDISYKVNV